MTNGFLAFAITVELVGLGLTGAGIGYEMGIGGHWGYIMITTGAWLISAGGVLFGKFLRKVR